MTEKSYAPGLKEKKISNKELKQTPQKEVQPVKEEKKNTEIKKVEEKVVKKVQIKKDFATVNISGAKISTKVSMAICNFIRGKKITKAIENLEQVVLKKKAVPMKGEFAHRKGKIMSGKYPVDASKEFIIFLKSLQANALQNGIEDAKITEAVPNMGSRPYGRFGRVKRKRTHIKLVAREKTNKKKQ
jgi:ribosomal protein L22